MPVEPMLVGQPVLLAIDIQQGGVMPGGATGIPHMPDHPLRMRRARSVIDASCVGGSGEAAHDASLRAVEYLQTGARRTAEAVIEEFATWGRIDTPSRLAHQA